MLKGVLLAGGTGSRLFPMTEVLSKQLLPVYDKPMIFYPLSILMLSRVREVMIISTPRDLPLIQQLLGDGSRYGMKLVYAFQEKPRGIPEALTISSCFAQDDRVCLVLGDNIFYGDGLPSLITEFTDCEKGLVFGYPVKNASRYGVLELDNKGKIARLIEKPVATQSNLALTGLYLLPSGVSELVKQLIPSARDELEIVDLCNLLLEQQRLNHRILGRGFTWLDAGTPESLLEASSLIAAIQKRQGFAIACLEEIAYRNTWINEDQLKDSINRYRGSNYGSYLELVLEKGKSWY